MASEFDTLLAIEREGQLNPAQRTRLEQLRASGSMGNAQGIFGGPMGQAGGDGEIPPFSFNWEQEEKIALEKLAPYYAEKLKEAQGDVDRAKRLIEEDYVRGKRYREEDQATQLGEAGVAEQEETAGTKETLNRRGLLFGEMAPGQESSAAPVSEFAQKFELDPLQKKQQARRAAIQRAIARQEEVAGVEKTRGLEEQNIAFPRFQRELEREKTQKAVLEMTPMKYQRELTKYNANVSGSSYLQR